MVVRIHVYHTIQVSTQSGLRTFIVRPETLKLVQERAGSTLEAVVIDKDFLSRTQVAQQLRERIVRWEYIKLKNFCTTEEMVSKLKRPPTEWDKNLCQLHF
jgi:hypothetical protein